MRTSTATVFASAALLLLVGACTTAPKKDLALEQVRTQLEELKADQELAGYAPLALGEAERALRQAETSTGDKTRRIHLIYMADRRIQIARAIAQREQLEQDFRRLETEKNEMLVRASQLEAERARLEAEQARMIQQATAEDAERARQEALQAQQREAESARTADQAREEAPRRPTWPAARPNWPRNRPIRCAASLKTCNCARPRVASSSLWATFCSRAGRPT
jgi:hypothetical protein